MIFSLLSVADLLDVDKTSVLNLTKNRINALMSSSVERGSRSRSRSISRSRASRSRLAGLSKNYEDETDFDGSLTPPRTYIKKKTAQSRG